MKSPVNWLKVSKKFEVQSKNKNNNINVVIESNEFLDKYNFKHDS